MKNILVGVAKNSPVFFLPKNLTIVGSNDNYNGTRKIIESMAAIPIIFGNEISSNRKGGISAQIDGAVRLYGNVKKFYRILENVVSHKYKRMSFIYLPISGQRQNTLICIDKMLNSSIEVELCSSRCYAPHEGLNTINIGRMFDDMMLSIGLIVFSQDSGLSEMKNIQIYNDRELAIVDENDECTDPNARRVRKMGPEGCVCMDGYASSNGGKIQGMFDTCISCISINDNSLCSLVSEHASGFPHGDTCAKVSIVNMK